MVNDNGVHNAIVARLTSRFLFRYAKMISEWFLKGTPFPIGSFTFTILYDLFQTAFIFWNIAQERRGIGEVKVKLVDEIKHAKMKRVIR